MYGLNWVDLYAIQESAPYFLDSAYERGNVDVLRVVLVATLMTFMGIHK
jgi:hypothetical protein